MVKGSDVIYVNDYTALDNVIEQTYFNNSEFRVLGVHFPFDIIETIDRARDNGITLLVVTNGGSYNSYKKRDQLSLMGLEFSNDEIISSREVAEIFLSYNKPEGPLGVMGNMGNDFLIPDLHCIELEQDISMFDEVNSFLLLGTVEWDTVWQDMLFHSLNDKPRPLFVANPDMVAPHKKDQK